ncbi:hypothetical protein TTRE_0000679801 [Trichuris trichiura]|uniref:Uncharacterized protein n=1 Tax=Trichuris trichiura TaxID=36087 RepID=A0A077ZDN2_TRITR|nr:hypothetical protein TTRE_0000679801 [Trichuris trichiura]
MRSEAGKWEKLHFREYLGINGVTEKKREEKLLPHIIRSVMLREALDCMFAENIVRLLLRKNQVNDRKAR